ncbi:hypothetical protein CEP52_017036 [Fusarium oligoseptatum]|uniref:BTB domain-containing protein n=1 Tax=Fusarium oligoseptatum TaxID=2604345 RepID=A0A428RX53_9HYPO|nr:hypothetical protein CEP52_017036 [Fusarium oligoseptatum]
MAAIPYERETNNLDNILSSDFFKFLIGPEKKQFFIHSSAIACQSRALEKLVNGDMREAQYAYTGDYRAAQPHTRDGIGLKQCFPPPSTSPPPKSKKIRKVKTFSSGGYMAVPTKDKDLWSQFKKLYPEPAPDHEVEDNTPEDDFSEVFLSHARLYVVADYYGISALKVLCLRKLHQDLERFTIHEEAIGDIAQLVRFCYEHTVKPDDLRELVNIGTAKVLTGGEAATIEVLQPLYGPVEVSKASIYACEDHKIVDIYIYMLLKKDFGGEYKE